MVIVVWVLVRRLQTESLMALRERKIPGLTLLAVAALLGACNGGLALLDEPQVGQRGSAIVNGTIDPGHAAAGILHSGNIAACTGTLIGSRTVLTAAHCVTTDSPPHQLLSPIHFYLDGFSGTKYSASSATVHPSYAGANIADLAVVRLSQEISGVAPAPISDVAPQPGEKVKLVGYGRTSEQADSSQFGTKRVAPNTIDQVAEQTFLVLGAGGTDGNLCNGDSGGPTFASRGGAEAIIGVHSTKGGACGDAGYDMRGDVFYAWIVAQSEGDVVSAPSAGQAPPRVEIVSPRPRAEVGPSFLVQVAATDDAGVTRVVLNLNGTPAGERRQAPYEFQLEGVSAGALTIGAVVYDAAGRRTTASVDVVVTSSASAGAGEGGASGDPAPGEFGAACKAQSDCSSGLCAIDTATDRSFCTSACNLAEASGCPRGSLCVPAGSKALCSPEKSSGAAADGTAAGGCAVGGVDAGRWPSVLLLLALLALLRRHRLARRNTRSAPRPFS